MCHISLTERGYRCWVGCPWRDIPDCYVSWQSVYGLFGRWQLDGT
jgi:transposase